MKGKLNPQQREQLKQLANGRLINAVHLNTKLKLPRQKKPEPEYVPFGIEDDIPF